MALATGAAIALGVGAAGAGFGISKLMAGVAKQASAPIPLPEPPAASPAADKATAIGKAKRAAVTQSVYTSPLGIQGQADVAKKMLLGQ